MLDEALAERETLTQTLGESSPVNSAEFTAKFQGNPVIIAALQNKFSRIAELDKLVEALRDEYHRFQFYIYFY